MWQKLARRFYVQNGRSRTVSGGIIFLQFSGPWISLIRAAWGNIANTLKLTWWSITIFIAEKSPEQRKHRFKNPKESSYHSKGHILCVCIRKNMLPKSLLPWMHPLNLALDLLKTRARSERLLFLWQTANPKMQLLWHKTMLIARSYSFCVNVSSTEVAAALCSGTVL